MLRKVMAAIITFSLCVGVMIPVSYADVKSSILTKVEAEKLAREKLGFGEEYKLQYSNLNTRDMQERQFWNLELGGEQKHASVVMAADNGEIINVNQWGNDYYGRAVTLIQDEAKKIAVDYIKSLEKNRFNETEEVTVKAPTIIPYDVKINYVDGDSYYFMFVRKINGEFFPNNYFRVTVSGANGSVTSYEMKWDEASYKGEKQLITQAKARELFEKENRLKLKYVQLNKYNPSESEKIVLRPVYVHESKQTDKINAITGKMLLQEELYNWNYYGYPMYRDEYGLTKEAQDAMVSYEMLEMIPEEGVISKEKAEKTALDMLKNYIDIEEINLNSTRYTNYYGGIKGKFWSMYWNSDEGSKYLQAVINAQNGEVLEVSYNKSEGHYPIPELRTLEAAQSPKQNVVNNDELLQIANEKIKAIFPKTKDELQLKIESDASVDKVQAYVSSSRYINGIPFEDNYVNMSYNNDTKEIVTLSYRWYDVEIQKGSNLVDNKAAHNIFYDNVGFEKYLVQLKDLEKFKKESKDLPITELLPVYSIKSYKFAFIDGVTGKLLNYLGEEFKEENVDQIQFKDIKGTTYEREIMLMSKMGILKNEDAYFKPSEILSRKDALKWIVEIGWTNKAYFVERYYYQNDQNENKDYFKDIPKDDPYYKYIQAGVEFGIIDKGDYFKPNDKVTKIDLTKWIINAMKQRELAKYSSIFKAPYKDKETIKTEDIGYVALAKYYNIFADKNIEVEFSPNTNLERGKFIHFMYNLIKDFKDSSY